MDAESKITSNSAQIANVSSGLTDTMDSQANVAFSTSSNLVNLLMLGGSVNQNTSNIATNSAAIAALPWAKT